MHSRLKVLVDILSHVDGNVIISQTTSQTLRAGTQFYPVLGLMQAAIRSIESLPLQKPRPTKMKRSFSSHPEGETPRNFLSTIRCRHLHPHSGAGGYPGAFSTSTTTTVLLHDNIASFNDAAILHMKIDNTNRLRSP